MLGEISRESARVLSEIVRITSPPGIISPALLTVAAEFLHWRYFSRDQHTVATEEDERVFLALTLQEAIEAEACDPVFQAGCQLCATLFNTDASQMRAASEKWIECCQQVLHDGVEHGLMAVLGGFRLIELMDAAAAPVQTILEKEPESVRQWCSLLPPVIPKLNVVMTMTDNVFISQLAFFSKYQMKRHKHHFVNRIEVSSHHYEATVLGAKNAHVCDAKVVTTCEDTLLLLSAEKRMMPDTLGQVRSSLENLVGCEMYAHEVLGHSFSTEVPHKTFHLASPISSIFDPTRLHGLLSAYAEHHSLELSHCAKQDDTLGMCRNYFLLKDDSTQTAMLFTPNTILVQSWCDWQAKIVAVIQQLFGYLGKIFTVQMESRNLKLCPGEYCM